MVPEPFSPLWYIEKLTDKLVRRRGELERYQNYYDGNHPFEIATTRYKTDFSRMLNSVSDNWMPIVVDAVEERLNVQGFRFGNSPNADDTAWEYWQRNYLDEDSSLHASTTLALGYSFMMVWGDSTDYPIITVEHPREMIVATEPGNRRKVIAALKMWTGSWSDSSDDFCNLYLPKMTLKFKRNSRLDWEEYERFPNPVGEVMIVPFVNRSDLYGNGKSEFHDVISTQDQINKLVKDMLVASEFAAFPQRWATGLIEEKTEKGEVINPFISDLKRMFVTENDQARFGTFTSADLSNYINALENRYQSLASRTRTPPHYLLGQSGQFPSGESLRAAETGLIAKERRRAVAFGEGYERVQRYAHAVAGKKESAIEWKAETIWGDPESRSEAQLADSLVKLMSIGVPMRALWERYGFSPPEIGRFRQYLQEEALVNMMRNGGQPTITIGGNVPAPAIGPSPNGAGSNSATVRSNNGQSDG